MNQTITSLKQSIDLNRLDDKLRSSSKFLDKSNFFTPHNNP
jgi:hypothetical protein